MKLKGISHLPLYHPCFWGLHDTEQDPPAAWCIRCGMEVYEPGQILCPDCLEEEKNEAMLP